MRLSLPSPQPSNSGGDLVGVVLSKKAGLEENVEDSCSVTVASTITSSWTMSSRRVVQGNEQPPPQEEDESDEEDYMKDPRKIMRDILVARRAGVTRSSSTGSRSSTGSSNSSVGYYDPASFVSELSFRSCDDLSYGYGDACSVGGTVVSNASTASTVCQKYPSAAEATFRHISKRRDDLMAKELNWSIKPDVLLDDGILSNPIHEMPLDEEEEEEEEDPRTDEKQDEYAGQNTEELPPTVVRRTPLSAVPDPSRRRVSPRRFIRLRRRYYKRPKPSGYHSQGYEWDAQFQSYDHSPHWAASDESYGYALQEPYGYAPEESYDYVPAEYAHDDSASLEDDGLLGVKFLDDEDEVGMPLESCDDEALEETRSTTDDFPAVSENFEYNNEFEFGFEDQGYFVEQKEECVLSASSSLTSLEELGEARSHCGSEQVICPVVEDDDTASTQTSSTSSSDQDKILSPAFAAVSQKHKEYMALRNKFAGAMTKQLGGKFSNLMGRGSLQDDDDDSVKPWWQTFPLWQLSLQG